MDKKEACGLELVKVEWILLTGKEEKCIDMRKGSVFDIIEDISVKEFVPKRKAR